jgi:hypothetical protein
MKRMLQIMGNSENVPAQQTHQAHYSGGYEGSAPRQPIRESYSPPPSYGSAYAGREDVDAMKNILEKLNALGGDEAPQQRAPLREAAPAALSYVGVDEWKVTTRLQESNGKQTKTFDVARSGEVFCEGLLLNEAAAAVVKFLNKGLGANSPKIQEVLDLEETYNRNRLDAQKIKARFNRCVELGESAAADVFRERHQIARANALSAQDEIKSIFESIR